MNVQKGGGAVEDLDFIFNSCYKYVKGYTLSLCLDEALAEDITQETFNIL